MIKPVAGSLVKISAAKLTAGMEIRENDEIVTLLQVDIDLCEEQAVSYIFRDAAGKEWCGYGALSATRLVKYSPGLNLVDILA